MHALIAASHARRFPGTEKTAAILTMEIQTKATYLGLHIL
jgi:hypothetical protein